MQKDTSTTGGNGHRPSSDAPMTQKVSQAVEGAVDQARNKVSQAGDALRNTDPQEVVRGAADYAQRGGRAAYDVVLDHPMISSMLGALLAYGLYFGLRSDDSYAGQARSYARAAQDRLNDVDWSDMQDRARDYARSARRQAGEGSTLGLLPVLVGLGVAFWMFSGSSSRKDDGDSSPAARI
jgi:hypothetical protein